MIIGKTAEKTEVVEHCFSSNKKRDIVLKAAQA